MIRKVNIKIPKNRMIMKRLFLTLLGAAVLAVPAVQAQKVNREALNAAIEKSDAEIQDPKKAAKAATWIKRAQAYYAALEAPTKGVFTTMPSALLKSTCGRATRWWPGRRRSRWWAASTRI